MDYDAEDAPPEITFHTIPAKGWTRHAQARNFEKQLAEVLKNKKFDAHISFSRVLPADWYFAADFPVGDDTKRTLFQKLSPRYRTFAAMERNLFSVDNKTRIFCSTIHQQEMYQKLYDTPAERFFQLPPGIDESFSGALSLRSQRDELREKLGVADSDAEEY